MIRFIIILTQCTAVLGSVAGKAICFIAENVLYARKREKALDIGNKTTTISGALLLISSAAFACSIIVEIAYYLCL